MSRIVLSCALAIVLAACAPTVEPGRSITYSQRGERIYADADEQTDIVFALDSDSDAREAIARVIESFSSMIGAHCERRSMPAASSVLCDPDDPDHRPVGQRLARFRVGFVSSDLGMPGSGVAACESQRGADGRLSQRSPVFSLSPADALDQPCDELPAFLGYCSDSALCPPWPAAPTDTREARQLIGRLRCAARAVGATGCPYGQPLEALWRALIEHGASEPAGSAAVNAGFLRSEARLVMVVVSRGEDHSVRDCAHDGGFSAAVGRACVDGRAALVPRANETPTDADRRYYESNARADGPAWDLDRYVSETERPVWGRSFDSLKPGWPSKIAFVAIAGIPTGTRLANLGEEPQPSQYDSLLGPASAGDGFFSRDPSRAVSSVAADGGPFSMRNERDPRCAHVVPACRAEGSAYDPARSCAHESQVALPSRRLVEVARRFALRSENGRPLRRGLLASICDANLRPLWETVAAISWGRSWLPPCLARIAPIERREDGLARATCVLHAELPEGRSCDPSRGQRPWIEQPVVDRGGVLHAVCEIVQAPTQRFSAPYRYDMPVGEGWYLDGSFDWTEPSCRQRLRFTPTATPPFGAALTLHCTVLVERDG